MNNRNKATAMDSVVELSPKIKRGRSTFNLPIKDYTSFNVGELVPLGGVTEVLPGDTFNVDLTTFIRITSPSKRAPMDNLHMDVFAFFIPYRFLDTGWVNVQGENPQAWVAPAKSCSQLRLTAGNIEAGSLLNHLGFPIMSIPSGSSQEVLIYPLYAYYKVVNDWFRDENLQNEIAFDNTNNVYADNVVPQINSKYVVEKGSLFRVAKYHDVFTSALPAPQKSANPVTLPLGKEAPIYVESSSALTAGDNYVLATNGTGTVYGNITGGTGRLLDASDLTDVRAAKVYVNLENATAATINSIRLAFQLQKAYELDARSGTRYTEAIEARFGTKNPDLRLGRSELLGHYRFDLNMQECMSTTNLGETGSTVAALKGESYLNGVGAGSSKTGNKQHICVKSFTEHGLFMIVGCVRPDLTYQQGIDKLWTKKERWDFYEPIFSNIGEMPIMKSMLYGPAILNDSVFGYQEAWYEYRYKQNNVSGILASDSNSGFDVFHYAQDFPSAPTLSSTFIEQNGAAIDRTLVFTSSTVDQFIVNCQGVIKATRVMPLFSTPGLIDHF